ncbi:MAG: type II/IV secretion system ATPase subunit [Candidatus Heimdallarchaeaceae archaeon]
MKKRINLGKVFKKAVKGYKKLKSLKEKEVSPPLETMKILASYLQILPEKAKPPEEKVRKPEEKIEKKEIVKIKQPQVDLRTINVVYPLIVSRKDNTPLATAQIKWSEAESSLVYYLIEPELTSQEKDLLEKIKTTLIEKLDVDFTTLRKDEAKEYLRKKFEEQVNLMATELSEERKKYLLYYIERDFIGLGKIEPLMQDPYIEDISCDGVGIPIFVYHRNPYIASVRTNVVFENKEELDIFVMKLAQRCGKTLSIAQPLVDGTLPDGSRVQATLGTDIARKGSNFTIRKFTKRPLTPTHLIKFKTIDPKIAAFLWLAVEYGRSILISGGVASGKTTLLNALSLFIRPELKIVSIEDTAELVLPHPHWVPGVARLPIAEVGGKKLGEVDLFDLLKESLRQRPDYLIVGEVRGKEAYVLFQQIATGHSSLSTIHADTFERLVDRLTTPPISLPATLIEALDLIIFVVRIKYGQVYVRRVNKIYEIIGYDRKNNRPIVNEIFRWNPANDTFEEVNPPSVLKKISEQYGIPLEELKIEMEKRIKVLNWMVERNIEDYVDVARVVKLYYSNPEELLASIS